MAQLNTKVPVLGCKPWLHSKPDIERKLFYKQVNNRDSEVRMKSGLLLRTSISHYPSPVFSSCYHDDPGSTKEFYFTNYMSMDGQGSVVTEWVYDVDNHLSVARRKFRIRNCLKHLLWISSQRVFIGYCDDMTLRGYKGTNFEEKVRVCVASSCLCIMYLEDLDELITAGQGHITSWRLHQIEFGIPFEWKDPPISCEFTDDQDVWILNLWYSRRTKTLLAVSGNLVYIIDMKTRKQISRMTNSHSASLSSCAFFPRYSFMITAARDGSIHVHNTITNLKVHEFPAHRDGLTGVDCMLNQPILLSWSYASGCVKLWRLDTLEIMDESTLSEGISAFRLVRSSNRVFYQTDCSIRVFDVNIFFTVFATLSAPAQFLTLSWIENRKQCQRSGLPQQESSDTAVESCERQLPGDGTVYGNNIESTEETTPTSRLLCILEDGYVITVSPVTVSAIHIIWPPTSKDREKHPVNVTVTSDGASSFVLPRNGKAMKFDCVVNPGEESRPKQSLSNVISITLMRVPVSRNMVTESLDASATHIGSEKMACAVLLGCDTGYLKVDSESSWVCLHNGEKKSLHMTPTKIHTGAVSIVYASSERKAFSAYAKQVTSSLISFQDAFITAGTDRVVNIWRMKFTKIEDSDSYDMSPHIMGKFNLTLLPRLMTGTGGTLMFSHDGGLLSLHRIAFDEGGAKVSSTTSIAIDDELRHRRKITSLAGSDVLHLFLTCGYRELIKIWDLDGQLLREIDIGSDCYSACFANGRDIIAAYKSHMALIDAHNYLPMEQLEELLDFDDDFNMKDIQAESPIPMKAGVHLSAYYAVRPILHSIDDPCFNFETITESQRKRGRSVSARKRALARRRKVRKYSVDVDQDSEAAESDEEHVVPLKKESLFDIPVRVADPAVLTESMIEKMKLWPIAPDGYIPNSVIRGVVTPLFNSLLREAVSSNLDPEKHRNNNTVSVKSTKEKDLKAKLLKFLSPSTGFENSNEIKPKAVKKSSKRSLKSEKHSDNECTALEAVLRSIGKEPWCPMPLNSSNMEKGLIRMARQLKTAKSNVILKILAAILKVHEECETQNLNSSTPLDAGRIGITVACQEVLARKLSKLLHHCRSEVREMAACVLSKFHFSVMQILKQEFWQPSLRRFLRVPTAESESDKRLTNVSMSIAALARYVDYWEVFTAVATKKHAIEEGKSGDFASFLTDNFVNKGVSRPVAKTWGAFVLEGFAFSESSDFQEETFTFPSRKSVVSFATSTLTSTSPLPDPSDYQEESFTLPSRSVASYATSTLTSTTALPDSSDFQEESLALPSRKSVASRAASTLTSTTALPDSSDSQEESLTLPSRKSVAPRATSTLTSTTLLPDSTCDETSSSSYSKPHEHFFYSKDSCSAITSGNDNGSSMEFGDRLALHPTSSNIKGDSSKPKEKQMGDLGAIQPPKTELGSVAKCFLSPRWAYPRRPSSRNEAICILRCSRRSRRSARGTTPLNTDRNVSHNELSSCTSAEMSDYDSGQWRSILHNLRKIRVSHDGLG